MAPNLRFGARLTADSIINYLNTNLSTLVLARILGAGVAGDTTGIKRGRCAADEAEPNHHPCVVSGVCQNSGRYRKLRVNFYKLLSVVGIINFPALLGLMVVSNNFVPLVFGEKWNSIIPVLQLLCVWWGYCAPWVTRLVRC